MTSPRSDDHSAFEEALDRAAAAVGDGQPVVYPTETVYGLGADALEPAAVERVFAAKQRPRDRPVSLAVAAVDDVETYTRPTERERAFMRAFLPGPVTVVLARRPVVPDVLTGGRDRVGIRIPDHPVALALLDRVGPLTATSANRSGEPSVRRIADLDPAVRAAVGAVVDAGETPGTESTVVDVTAGTVHRRGASAAAVEAWLADGR